MAAIKRMIVRSDDPKLCINYYNGCTNCPTKNTCKDRDEPISELIQKYNEKLAKNLPQTVASYLEAKFAEKEFKEYTEQLSGFNYCPKCDMSGCLVKTEETRESLAIDGTYELIHVYECTNCRTGWC
jgi:hypothetical protein